MYSSYIEKDNQREILKESQKRILSDSLILGSQIIKNKKNVWDLVKRGIVDEDHELITCVRILSTTEEDDLVDKIHFAFRCGYPFFEKKDYEDVVGEYREIREWLDHEDSQE